MPPTSRRSLADIVKTTDQRRNRVALQSQHPLWKNALLAPDDGCTAAETTRSCVAPTVLSSATSDALRAYQAVDFDDLIRLPVELFEADPERSRAWRSQLRYLLVDEYQDTNCCQYRLLQLLAGRARAFTAVGDDDQAIYAWRGADGREPAQPARRTTRACKVIKLEQNYRSTRAHPARRQQR